MNIQLSKIEMNINGVGITSFDVPTSMTPYGTREVISGFYLMRKLVLGSK